MYTVVFNMPGCLPESRPGSVETLDEARNLVIDRIMLASEELDVADAQGEREWEYALTVAKSVPAEGGWFKLPDGYVADIQKVEAGQNAD